MQGMVLYERGRSCLSGSSNDRAGTPRKVAAGCTRGAAAVYRASARGWGTKVRAFFTKQGCTLDRFLRSDVCNSYFCGGLQVYLKGGDIVTPTLIIAGVGDKMRTSPILMP
jgi:hypothetical protein